MAPDKPGFLEELKRRHVWRVAAAYAIAGWLIVQIATQVFPFFNIPNWGVRLIVILIVIGFPVAVAFAWIYELTPEGIRRTEPADSPEARPASTNRQIGRKLNALIVAVLVLAVALLAWRLIVVRHAEPGKSAQVAAATKAKLPVSTTKATAAPATSASAATAIAVQPILAKSVAVLPFENLSTDKGNAYFADGMQDLILTKLADIGDLKVISRTSTMKYASHPDDLKTIGQQLGVATILEGSVQKVGNQVLINVQLIDAKTDSHIWAQSYQRTLNNIFGVEGEVAQKVADALKAKLTPAETARVTQVPTTNTEAYNAFLQGEYYAQRVVANLLSSDFEQAEAYYRHAVAQDPQFALAWARLAFVSAAQQQMTFTGDQQPVLAAQAKAALGHALALAPNSPDVRLAQAWYDHWIAHDLKAALTAFETVLVMQPQNAQALFGAGVVHEHLGQYREAVELLRKATELSPKDALLLTQLGEAELSLRDYTRGQQALRRALALDPDSAFALSELVNSYFLVGDPDGAKALLDAASTELQGNPVITVMRVAIALQRRDYAAARKAAARMQPGGRYSEAFANVQRGDVEWLAGDRALARQYYQRAAPIYEAEVEHYPDNANALSGSAWILMRLGKDKEALARMQHAIDIASGRGDRDTVDGLHWQMARMLGQLGKGDQTVAILGDLLSRSSGWPVTVASLKVDWVWDPIRHDPAFQALLKKYGRSPANPAAAGTSAASAPQAY